MRQWGVACAWPALRLLDKPTRAVLTPILPVFDPQPKSAAARSRNSNKKWPRSPGTGGVWWGQELPEDSNSYMSQAALIEAWLSPVSSARVPASMARCWLVQVQWGPLRYWWLCRQGFRPSEGGASEAQTPRNLPCRPEIMPWRSEVMASEGPMCACLD